MKKTNDTTAKAAASTDSIPNTPLKYVRYTALKHWPWLLVAFLMVTCAELIGISLPYIMKEIVDVAASDQVQSEKLLFWIMLLPVSIGTMFLFWRLSGFAGMIALVRIEAESYKQLYDYLSLHSHSYFTNRFAGALSNKASNASEGTFRLLDGTLWGHFPHVLGFIAAGVYIYFANAYVGFVFFGLVLILIPLNIIMAKHRRPYVIAYADSKSSFRGRTVDVMTNISAVRQFSRRQFELKGLSQYIKDMVGKDLKQWRMSEWMLVLNNFLITTAFVFMMLVLFKMWQIGQVTVGDFVLVSTLMMSMQRVLTFLGNSINQFIKDYGQLEEGLQEILVPHEVVNSQSAKELKTTNGEIVWDNVAFEYGNNQVFKDFDLTIKSGQRIGLVGASGAGKTTFVSLLLRQHDIDGGVIAIDGQSIAEVTQDSLREAIAIVPQEPMLFHRSIRENIAYGKPSATSEEIEEVARKAQAHEFILELEDGYDTMVGERGVKLSGGQKQRIAIARAMLKDAPILILDEATSALDSESEVEIQKALHTLMDDKTVVAVAHRLSTLREMDRIIVLEKGQIVEDGTHQELTQSGGTYQKLWEHQAGGFLQEEVEKAA